MGGGICQAQRGICSGSVDDCVVIDGVVVAATTELKGAGSGSVESGNTHEVVADQQPLSRLARVKVIAPGKSDSGADVDQRIADDRDIAGDRPGCGAALIARRDHKAEAVLRFGW